MTTGETAQELPGACETTVTVGRKLFRLDGMVDRLLEKARMAMARPERGPDPDADIDRDDDLHAVARAFERLADRMDKMSDRPPDNGYHERQKKDSSLKAIIIGCTIAIVSAGIIGMMTLSNQFSALRAEFSEWKNATEHRLEQLERRP